MAPRSKTSTPGHRQTAWIALGIALVLGAVLGAWWLLQGSAAPATVADRSALVRAHAPTEGRSGAPVELVEFFDPACGTCRQFQPVVHELMAQHPGQIRLVLRYAAFHKGSDKVVAMLAAAQRQGRFREALDALFASQDDWASNHVAKPELALQHLQGIGLNLEQLAFDMTAPELQQALAQDAQDANTLGVAQTPEFFVNGRPLPSFGIEPLRQLVAEELARTR